MLLRLRWLIPPLVVFACIEGSQHGLVAGGRRTTKRVRREKRFRPTRRLPGWLFRYCHELGWWVVSRHRGSRLPQHAARSTRASGAEQVGLPSRLPHAGSGCHADHWLGIRSSCNIRECDLLGFGRGASLSKVSLSGDQFVAFAVVLGVCAFPTAPLLQVAYSEGLALLLLTYFWASGGSSHRRRT